MAHFLRVWAPRYVLFVLVGVGAYDLATGLVLLLVPDPQLVAPFDILSLDAHGGALALLRRLGAFGIVTGATTIAWAFWSRRDRRLRSLMLVVYTVAGLGFASVDGRFFSTAAGYALSKQVIGTAFVLALVAHFAVRPGPARQGAGAEASDDAKSDGPERADQRQNA